MSPSPSYLFVYGTLRRDSAHPMAQFLAGHARFVAVARTPGRLYHLGSYPGMVSAMDVDDWVHGELFELLDPDAVLAELDRYEGCTPDRPESSLFRRIGTPVTSDDGTVYPAWLYVYTMPVSEAQQIPSGRFRIAGATETQPHGR